MALPAQFDPNTLKAAYNAVTSKAMCGLQCFSISFAGIIECNGAWGGRDAPNETHCPPFQNDYANRLDWYFGSPNPTWQVVVYQTKSTEKLEIGVNGTWLNATHPVFYCSSVDLGDGTVNNEITLGMCGDDFEDYFPDSAFTYFFGKLIDGYGGSASW